MIPHPSSHCHSLTLTFSSLPLLSPPSLPPHCHSLLPPLPAHSNPLALPVPHNVFDGSGDGLVLVLEYVFLLGGVPDPDLPRLVCTDQQLDKEETFPLGTKPLGEPQPLP